MKKIFVIFFLVCICLASLPVGRTHCATSARGMCVIEAESGRVLFSQNKDAKLANASTTKIVTAITVLDHCNDLDEKIVVSDSAIGIEGTSIYLKKDEEITVRDLLYGTMLASGNDSATALAVHTAGSVSAFCDLMNETARKVGATNSHFANPHGLDHKDHYTTAYDLALITAYALKNDTFADVVSTVRHTIPQTNKYETRYLKNKNRLLSSLDGCIGVKTGYTSKAGRCLVSATKRNGMTAVCVVLNCGPMFEESAELLNQVYRDYEYAHVLKSNVQICNEYYIDKLQGQLYLCTKEDFYYPIKKGEMDKIKVKYETNDLSKGSLGDKEIGKIFVYFDNQLIKTQKLYTINKITVLENQDKMKSIILEWTE